MKLKNDQLKSPDLSLKDVMELERGEVLPKFQSQHSVGGKQWRESKTQKGKIENVKIEESKHHFKMFIGKCGKGIENNRSQSGN